MINQIPLGPLIIGKTDYGNKITITFPKEIEINEDFLWEIGKYIYKMLEKKNVKDF